MPRRIDHKEQRDFTGGLNLTRSLLQLADNETPDVLNMDVNARGGFGLRKGVEQYTEDLPGVAHSVLQFRTTGAVAAPLVGVGTGLYKNSGGTWNAIFTGAASSGPYRGTTFKDRIYVSVGPYQCRRWDGTTHTALVDPAIGSLWNNNLAAPTVPPANGKFPKAAVSCAFMGSMFVANITEDTTAYPCRVRWSHPLFPEDWHKDHYIDIEPEDGESITALMPMVDRLLVFKQNSVHAIYGAPPTDLAVQGVSRELGAPSQEAVTGTDEGVMFWHEGSGIHVLTAGSLEGTVSSWAGERIWPALEDGRISAGRLDEVKVGWVNRRLWVSVPWEGSATRNRVFVYDPFCGKRGAWTFYDVPCGPFLTLHSPGEADIPLAAHPTLARLVRLDVFDKYTDEFTTNTDVHIASHYTTRWYDNGEGVVKKRWKRPETVLLAGQDATITVNVLRDYDPTLVHGSFNLVTLSDEPTSLWGTAVWDTSNWARDGGERNEVQRGSPLGSARSVALRFDGPATNVPWRVDALTMKWISKRVRN